MVNRSALLLAFVFGSVSVSLNAQSEAVLRDYFEGQTVTLKIAMPGTENGVDVYPGAAKPVDFPRHAGRLKDFGTAIRAGDPALVTKIKVKGKLIEFQLDGGGYGTSGDETSSSVSVPSAPKTKREQNLEGELRREQDPARRRAIKEELDDLKASREREDARNRAAVAEAQESRKESIRQRRIEGGSRFNLRYRDGVPAAALTPEAVKAALAAYVGFDAGPAVTPVSTSAPAPDLARPRRFRKGMLATEADSLFGPATKSTDRMEGRLKVNTRRYATDDGRVSAEFVEGVLIRYTISSE